MFLWRPRLGLKGGSLRARGLPFVVLVVVILASLPLWSGSPPQVQAQVPAPLTITMGDVFFQPNVISVAPNQSVSLRVVNAAAGPHTFTLFDDVGVDVPTGTVALQNYYDLTPKFLDLNFTGSGELTTTIPAIADEGVYTFVCMEPGHAGLGMVGTMTVTSGPPPGGIDPLLLGIAVAVAVIVIAVAAVFILRRRT